MFIELVQLVTDRSAVTIVKGLSNLDGSIELPSLGEGVKIGISILPNEESIFELLEQRGRKRHVFVVMSSDLVGMTPNGPTISPLATRLLEGSRQGTIMGLIGIGPDVVERIQGFDYYINEESLDCLAIRDAVSQVATRLWYKLPPAEKGPDHKKFTIKQVTTKQSLRLSLELRYQIYCALGYLSEPVRASQSRIELDCYDPTAIHYVVTSYDDPGRVVASMRLLIPEASPLLIGIRSADYRRWCGELANDEPTRVFRELLRRGHPNALPALDSFDYFTRIKDQPRFKELVLPRNSCEISRVVVDPEYRGRGLLNLLMEKAIGIAACNRKRYLLLECAPFHEPMYGKFGFQVIEDEGQRYYARERRLDAWVVAMYRELKDHDAENARKDQSEAEKLYRMFIHDVQGHDVSLTIECEKLDLRDIGKCLSVPYPPPASPKPGTAYVPKAAKLSLGSAIRTAFKQLDPLLEAPLREVFRLLPKARLKLGDHAGREFIIEKAHCELGSTESRLRDRVSHWLG